MKVNKKWLLLIILFIVVTYSSFKVADYISNLSYKKKYNIKISNEEINKLKDELNIVKTKYNWSSGLNIINNPKILVFHHAAIKNITAEGIHELHKKKGWEGIGYHYFISKDGTIYEGRPERTEGAHTIGKNKESIGICIEGNLEESEITLNQIISLENLSVYLCLKYDIKDLLQHKDLSNTLCPGKNFPMKEIKDSITKDLKNYKHK